MQKLLISLLAILLVSCGGQNSEKKVSYQYIDDLKEVRIAALMGSVEEAILEKRFPNGTVERYETMTDMVQALKQNRVDAVSLDGYTLPYLNHTLGGGMVALDDSLGTMGLAAAFQKDDKSGLREQFNHFLKVIKQSGLHAKMLDKWIYHFDTAKMPDLKLPTEGDPLVVATCPTLPPTSFLQGNKSAGFDMEVLQQFAIYINRPIKIQNLNFSALITSLATGKVDMIISSLIITEERAQMVAFSDSYMDFDMDVIVRNENKKGYTKKSIDYVTKQQAVDESGDILLEDEEWLSSIQESFEKNLIKERRYEMVLSGLKTTLVIAFLSAIFGTILGAFICFLKMRKNKFLKTIANVYINTMRGTPVLVLLLIMFYVVFNKVDIDPVMVSVITFSMNFAAYVSEMFRTSIEGVDNGQTEAGIALGFSKFRTFYHIVLPQAFKKVLPVYKGEMISMVKMTSIVGYIAVEDLTKVSDIIRSRTFDALFPLIMVAVLYFVIAWLFTVILDFIGRKFN